MVRITNTNLTKKFTFLELNMITWYNKSGKAMKNAILNKKKAYKPIRIITKFVVCNKKAK